MLIALFMRDARQGGCAMRAKARIAIVAAAVVALPGLAEAGITWADIHCAGSGYHTDEEPPNENPTSSTTQCHGVPGDLGSCTGYNAFANFTVTCSMTQNGSMFCSGSLSCPVAGSTFTCGGRGYQAFAGVQAQGDGSNLGFLQCIKPDGTLIQHECPAGVT
jgi:hypothetical protein